MSRVRVAVLDSGIHPTHPHVGGLSVGAHITSEGIADDTLDRLGHGTAVAAVIHYLAPEAEIVPVKIFDRQLSTNISIIIRAIDWCLEHNIQVINLSLGTTNANHHFAFEQAVQRTAQQDAVIVSAFAMNQITLLPGKLDSVIGVIADEHCEQVPYSIHQQEKLVFGALPFPRDIPGVPRQANLNGVSFSVARVCAVIARQWLDRPQQQSWQDFLASRQLVTAQH